jgi:ABC-2 type transport system ATP-binding protein
MTGCRLAVKNLRKRYGALEAVRDVSFEVSQGEIVGLLGPNGAGKTSTLECVIGLRRPDGGSIEICGIDALVEPERVKQQIGAQLQATALQDKITPREAIALFGAFYEKPAKVEELIERFALGEKADATFDSLSEGQKQRLALALAVVNNPQVLFLDEPTSGLDPQSRRELHGVIQRMRADGRTVLMTTHYIEEAQQLCDRIAIIDHGRIIASDTPEALIGRAKTLPRITFQTAKPLEAARVETLTGARGAEWKIDRGRLQTSSVSQTVIELVKLLDAQQNELVDLHISKPSLEDVFIELTGSSLRD